jgi:hypothetical protein
MLPPSSSLPFKAGDDDHLFFGRFAIRLQTSDINYFSGEKTRQKKKTSKVALNIPSLGVI